jgi:hypothetical protein
LVVGKWRIYVRIACKMSFFGLFCKYHTLFCGMVIMFSRWVVLWIKRLAYRSIATSVCNSPLISVAFHHVSRERQMMQSNTLINGSSFLVKKMAVSWYWIFFLQGIRRPLLMFDTIQLRILLIVPQNILQFTVLWILYIVGISYFS